MTGLHFRQQCSIIMSNASIGSSTVKARSKQERGKGSRLGPIRGRSGIEEGSKWDQSRAKAGTEGKKRKETGRSGHSTPVPHGMPSPPHRSGDRRRHRRRRVPRPSSARAEHRPPTAPRPHTPDRLHRGHTQPPIRVGQLRSRAGLGARRHRGRPPAARGRESRLRRRHPPVSAAHTVRRCGVNPPVPMGADPVPPPPGPTTPARTGQGPSRPPMCRGKRRRRFDVLNAEDLLGPRWIARSALRASSSGAGRGGQARCPVRDPSARAIRRSRSV
jgi:hypothetical protein